MFGIGVTAYFLLYGSNTPQFELEGTLVPCRQFNAYELMANPKAEPKSCEYFMAFEQNEKGIDVTEAIGKQVDPYLIEQNCGTLYVTISSDRMIRLNTMEVGSIEYVGNLRKELRKFFSERSKNRAFQEGMETRGDLPMSKRIPSGVLVGAACTINYEEVMQIVRAVRESGANTIAIQTKGCNEVDSMFEML